MKNVHRKTVDDAVNQILVQAGRDGVSLIWDRAERQQPQCGFGRLSLCCHDCMEGPCRINPFGKADELTICGRDRSDLAGSALVGAVTDGQQALARLLAVDGYEVALGVNAKDDLIGYAPETILPVLGKSIAETLRNLAVSHKTAKVAAGLEALRSGRANVVVFGRIPAAKLEELKKQPVALHCVCGMEGSEDVAALSEYDSQETVLLTGEVDAVVVGAQCVMPAVLDLAAKKNVRVFCMDDAAADIAAAAAAAFAAREAAAGAPRQIVVSSAEDAGAKAAAAPKGAVYIGGCGDISHTQGGEAVKLARKLIEEGYAVISAGCIGLSLARADLPEASFAYLGACTNAGLFLEIGGAAVFTELVHHKTLATAAAFAAEGITTYIDNAALFAEPYMAECLARCGIRPLAMG